MLFIKCFIFQAPSQIPFSPRTSNCKELFLKKQQEIEKFQNQLNNLQNQIDYLKNSIEKIDQKSFLNTSPSNNSNDQIFNKEIEKRFRKFKEHKIEQIYEFERTLCEFEKDLYRMNDKIEDLIDLTEKNRKLLNETGDHINKIDERVILIETNTEKLLIDNKLQKKLNDFTKETIEYLKMIKATKEELNFIEVMKADKTTVCLKVPYTEFNQIRHDLSCSIVQLKEELMKQNQLVENLKKDLSQSIDLKFNIKGFEEYEMKMKNKFDKIDDILNDLIKLRIYPESCGTVKYLTQVQCLTCGDNVRMLSDNQNKQQIQSNMRKSSDIYKNAKLTAFAMKKSMKELCAKRYVGGGHTILSADEKILKTVNLNFETCKSSLKNVQIQYIEGKDGAFYRAPLK